MAKLDVVKAATAGFGVIGRNPVAVVVWGLVLLLVGVAPVLLVMGGFMSNIIQLAALQEAGVEPDPAMVAPMMASIMVFYPVLFITAILVRVIMTGAIFRAVLEPENRRWFYVRLGSQELWIAVVFVVIAVVGGVLGGVFGIFIGATAGATAIAGGVASSEPPLWIVPLIAVLVIAGGVAFLWLALRFSMALPMTFAERQFRLFESWSFTRGNAGGLFLVGLLAFLLVIVLEIVASIIGMIVIGTLLAGAVGVSGMDEQAMETFFQQPPAVWVAALAPWLIFGGLVASVLGAIFTTMFTAPWAEAYRQLRGEPATSEPAAATA